MREGFSFNREFDFVRLDGLRRATGRPPHEWDIYIIKELIDNALDADEALWQRDLAKQPGLTINVEYIYVEEHHTYQFFVQVRNLSLFPVGQIKDIFDTQWYTSRKAFLKGLTRGALGNALKTLLGIPYALRNRVAGNWTPDLKPMSIRCSAKEYLPRFIVDSTAQTIQFEFDVKDSKSIDGTEVTVGVDHFEQEMPRSLTDIKHLAEYYHLCNPHVRFSWNVEIAGQEYQIEYEADHKWRRKFTGRAPVQWYSLTAFKDLISALYRKQCGDNGSSALPIAEIIKQFSGLLDYDEHSQLKIESISKHLSLDRISSENIEGQVIAQFYRVLNENSANFDSLQLGAIGYAHIRTTLQQILPIAGEVTYHYISDAGDDPNTPFVIEGAIAALKAGKREILTAINFTPTYNDPFLSRKLFAKINSEESVLGLRGLLDLYDQTEDVPLVLFLHLICPNVEHHEFSKTEINHLPFRDALGELLDELLTTYKQKREDEDRKIEGAVFQALEAILNELSEGERFVFDQLVEKLRARLNQESSLAAWMETPDGLTRLQRYINNYQSNNAILAHRVARPSAGSLSIPLHPESHFSISADHISRELVIKHNVNKLLYIQVRELEPVVIDNNWLCRMDMAMLCNPPGPELLREALAQCMVNTDLVLMVLHDADEKGHSILEEIRVWLMERQLDPNRVIDLGLVDMGNMSTPTRLVEMMPNEIVSWLMDRFALLGIQVKAIPSLIEIRHDIREKFEQMLLGHLWEGMSHQMQVARLIDNLDGQFNFTRAMRNQGLDLHLKSSLEENFSSDSYGIRLEKVVEQFFRNFMLENAVDIQKTVRSHLQNVKDNWYS